MHMLNIPQTFYKRFIADCSQKMFLNATDDRDNNSITKLG